MESVFVIGYTLHSVYVVRIACCVSTLMNRYIFGLTVVQFHDDVAIAYERCLILDVGTDNLVRDYWVV